MSTSWSRGAAAGRAYGEALAANLSRGAAGRVLLRLSGYLCVAAGFVVLVIDGARSIANSALRFTSVSETVTALIQERYALIQPAVERNIHPLLWDPVLLSVMRMPTAFAALLLGFALLWLGRQPEPQIGIVTRR